MQVPANHVIPRLGAVRVLSASMVLWGLSAAATAFVTSEHQLFALRFCLGLTESAFFPGCLLYLTRWFPDSCSGRAMAYFTSAASVGGLLSSAGSGLLLSALDGALGVRGWRWLLGVEGVPTVALGLLAPLLLAETPREAPWLTADERRTLTDALHWGKGRARADGHEGAGTPAPAPAASTALTPSAAPASSAPAEGADAPLGLAQAVRAALVQTPCLLFCAQYFVSAIIANCARFFLPTLLKEVYPRLGPAQLGLIFAGPAALKVALAAPVGACADAGGAARRFQMAWGKYALAAALIMCAGLGMRASGGGGGSARAAALVGMVAAADVLCQLAIPIFWSLHNSLPLSSVVKGCSIAIVNSLGNTGGFIGPVLLGHMHDSVTPQSACGADYDAGGPGRGCTAQWAGGLIVLGIATLLGTGCVAAVLRGRLSLPSTSAGKGW